MMSDIALASSAELRLCRWKLVSRLLTLPKDVFTSMNCFILKLDKAVLEAMSDGWIDYTSGLFTHPWVYGNFNRKRSRKILKCSLLSDSSDSQCWRYELGEPLYIAASCRCKFADTRRSVVVSPYFWPPICWTDSGNLPHSHLHSHNRTQTTTHQTI